MIAETERTLLHDIINRSNGIRDVGRLQSVNGILGAKINSRLGDLVDVRISPGKSVTAEVIGFRDEMTWMMPYNDSLGLAPGCEIIALNEPLMVPTGNSLRGRVLNGVGEPMDSRPLGPVTRVPLISESPSAMSRPPIDASFQTGIRAIDGILTCGQGQRVGLFAGSGVGKSTLLGDIARTAKSDINVVALIGERAREVRPFLDRCLGAEGLKRSVVIVSTASDSPLMRIRAAQTAVTIADAFRQDGANVLMLLDSLTRMAHAQREIGLLLDEPPGARGYPPSAFQVMARLLEYMGRTETGSVTGLLTVLVDGDDTEEPVADSARSVLDGHIVLTRSLAQKNHYPAIDIAASVSRVFHDVVSPEQRSAAETIRKIMATHAEVADLIRIGAYRTGTSPEIDLAVSMLPQINHFLQQATGTAVDFQNTIEQLCRIAAQWNTQRSDALRTPAASQ